jgi:hypothetical protein
MKPTLLWVILILAVVGCTKIDYIGDEFSPTSYVDLYFSEADVARDYRVMGEVVATASDWVSAEKMQKKIMEKARQKGADGVIILGMERYRSGESTTRKETTQIDETKKGTTSTTTATTETNVQKEKEIRATFIKYR